MTSSGEAFSEYDYVNSSNEPSGINLHRRATIKRLLLTLGATASFIGAAVETNEQNLSDATDARTEIAGPESHDPLDTTLKVIGLSCAIGVFNVKRPD